MNMKKLIHGYISPIKVCSFINKTKAVAIKSGSQRLHFYFHLEYSISK